MRQGYRQPLYKPECRCIDSRPCTCGLREKVEGDRVDSVVESDEDEEQKSLKTLKTTPLVSKLAHESEAHGDAISDRPRVGENLAPIES